MAEQSAPPAPALIGSKFRVRPCAVPMLTRAQLLERLEDQHAARLILVRAPAGYGKSELLAQWRQRLLARRRPQAWLSLDRGDRRPEVAFPYVVSALEQAGFEFDRLRVAEALALVPRDPDAAAREIVGAIHPPSVGSSLLIDGLDELAFSPGIVLIETLLEYADALQIVATARRRPPLPLARLRAAGLLHEIGAADLRFSGAEVMSLFDARLPAGYAQSLHTRTDGVAIALRYARAAIEQDPAQPWTAWLDEYYREQVLETLPDDLRPIVSQLVIVDRFDVSLASAIVGRDVSAELERLHREESLLTIDPRSGLFRFPPLLRESLCKQLLWLHEDGRREMHRRAEAWFAARGLLHETLHHALAANDTRQALQLFRQIGGSAMLIRFGVQPLRSALEQLQHEVTTDAELFEWSRVLLLAQQGAIREATALANRICSDRVIDDTAAPGPASTALAAREVLTVETLLAAYSDRRLPVNHEQRLFRAAEELTSHDHLTQGFISNLLCWIRCERAEFSAADSCLERAIAEFTADGGLYGSLFMHLHRINIRFWQNRLDEALREAHLVGQLQRLFFPADGRLQWLCRLFEGFVLFELGRLDEAAARLHDILDGLDANEGWFEAQLLAHVVSARMAASRGDADAAAAILARGSRIAAERELPRLGWHMLYQCVSLALNGNAEVEIPQQLRFHTDPAHDPEFFTWRERFQCGVLGVQVAMRERRFASAEEILSRLESQVAVIDVPRARTSLDLLQASLRHAQADDGAARALLATALASFEGSPSDCLPKELGLALPTSDVARSRGRPPLGISAADPTAIDRPSLTPREREILALISSGHPNKVIAQHVGLSEATIKFHLRNVYRKLKAHNRVQALSRSTGSPEP